MLKAIEKKTRINFGNFQFTETAKVNQAIIPSGRIRYLSELTSTIREYDQLVKNQAVIASKLYQLQGALQILRESKKTPSTGRGMGEVPIAIGIEGALEEQIKFYNDQLTPV